MKKFKAIVPIFLSLVFALALPLAACKGSNKKKPTPEPEPEPPVVTTALQSITVDATDAKTDYYVGEDFTAAGLVVKATLKDSDKDGTYEQTLTSSQYVVDSSAYNKEEEGDYTISVSYTLSGVTKSAEYSVSVTLLHDGLEVKFAETGWEGWGDNKDIHLSSSVSTVEIDVSKIVVKEINDDGTVGAAVEDYTVELYKGTTKVELTEGKASVGEGAYQIWASKASAVVEGFVRKAFVTVYVIDDVVSLEWVSTAENTVTEQIKGDDEISSTLSFKLTYESGKTETLGSEDVVWTTEINTKKVATDAKAAAKYEKVNVMGVKVATEEVEVTYTIKDKPATGAQSYALNYVASASGTKYATSWANDTEDLDSKVTVSSTASTFKTKEKKTADNSVTYADYAEIKDYANKGIEITVGSGLSNVKITVYASHTSKAARTIYLAKDTTAGTDNVNVLDSKAMGTTEAAPANLEVISADNLAEGKYYVYSDGTTVHVYAVVVEYTVPVSTSYGLNYVASASGTKYATSWANDTEDLDSKVTVSSTASTFKTKEKKTADNSVTYADYAEIKDYANKGIVITVGSGLSNVKITVYASHTSKAARTIYLAKDTTVGTDNVNVLDSKAMGTTEAAPANLEVISADNLAEGKYYVYSDGTTVHVYAVVVEYTATASASVSYGLNYAANATETKYATSWVDGTEDLDAKVTVTSTASTFKTKEKKTADNSVTYTDYAEIKDYANKGIEITVGSGLSNVKITVYASHTSKAARTIYLAKDTTAGSNNVNVLDSKAMGTAEAAPANLEVLSADNLAEGKYYVYSDGTTVHVYAVVIEYTVG